jgi:hypothetical protein
VSSDPSPCATVCGMSSTGTPSSASTCSSGITSDSDFEEKILDSLSNIPNAKKEALAKAIAAVAEKFA